jgi:predicted transcriptional regulator
MSGATVRITDDTRAALRQLAIETNQPMQEILAKAVEAYRRQRILELANAVYAALSEDPSAWQSETDERALWDGTLADDLSTG